MVMRAARDAAALHTPLFLVQAADASASPMPVDLAAKLTNRPNPKDTGGMHGMLAVHLGMRIRLLEPLDLEQGLVKDAEGTVVHVVANPLEQDNVDAAMATGAQRVYLNHVPLGFWVLMDKYASAPFCEELRQAGGSLEPSVTKSLVFIEPKTSEPFLFRGHRVTRTGWPFSHGRACRRNKNCDGVLNKNVL